MPSLRHKERHAFAVPPKASDGLVWLLARAYLNYTVVLQQELESSGLAKQRVRPGMGHLLFALFNEDSLTLRDLAARTGLAPSSVTEMVQRMERAGLLSRERDTEDKRAVRISLTRAGRKLEPGARTVVDRLETIIEDGFTTAEARQMRTGLSRVVRNLHEHLKV